MAGPFAITDRRGDHRGGMPVTIPALRAAAIALLAAATLAASWTPAGAQSPPKPVPQGGKKVKQTAIITMEKGGEIRIAFFPEDAPRTVQNFVTLAKKGFYDGTTFHRVEPKFVAQGGDPLSKTLKPDDERIGTGGPGYTVKAEFNKQKHVRGAVAMARGDDPNSAGSQFYITLAPAHFLDGQYTVFGAVTAGMDVVDGIRPGDRMKSVKIVEAAQ
jgi:peptidyl-prolyl cis-trans isomerase B (cyclophilin B)